MQGPSSILENISDVGEVMRFRDDLGIIPRTLWYIFNRIGSTQSDENHTTVHCTFVEIYNETVYDLLNSSETAPPCTVREGQSVFVEGCREIELFSADEAITLLLEGARNRHVAETSMNRESSRSHSIMTLMIRSSMRVPGETDLVDIREARFNLVDLAGSERQQLSCTTGIRLKEAGSINRSLLALSSVINALVEIASSGRQRHVHYRDSKLTFLLRDSLGGNAKTSIVATVSPSPACLSETLSTLRFAQRAKLIRNRVLINQDFQGDLVPHLQAEVASLKEQLRTLIETKNVRNLVSSSIDDNQPNPLYMFEQIHSECEAQNPSDCWTKLLVKHNDLFNQLKNQKARLDLLEELLKRKEHQINSERLLSKFKDSTIRSLNESIADKNVSNHLKTELDQYKAEIVELRRQIDSHPEVLRYAYEAIQYKATINRLQGLVGSCEEGRTYADEVHGIIDRATEREVYLLNQLSLIEQRIPALKSPEVPLNSIDESGNSSSIIIDSDLYPAKSDDYLESKSNFERYLPKSSSPMQELEKRLNSLVNISVECNQQHDVLADLERKMQQQVERRLSEKRSVVELELVEYKDKVSDLSTRHEAAIQTIDTLKSAVEVTTHDRDIIKTQLEDLTRSKLELMEQLGISKQEIIELGDRVYSLSNHIETLSSELVNKDEQFSNRLDVLSNEYRQNLADLELCVENLKRQNTQHIKEINDVVLERDILASKLKELDNERAMYQEAAESRSRSIADELEEMREEVLRVRRENDKLTQHSNLKQKLQYHMQIKEENNQFREEIRSLREELARLGQRNIEISHAHGINSGSGGLSVPKRPGEGH